MAFARGVRGPWRDLRDHRHPRLQARDRVRRQADEPAGRAATRSRTSRSARCCSRCSRSASAATRCGGCSGPRSDAGRRARTPASTASPHSVSGLAYGALCVLAVEILLGSGSSGSTTPKKLGGRRPRLAGRDLDRRSGRPGDDRRRALPGLQGHHAEVPRGLEDRGDVARGPQVDRTRRDGRSGRASGRLRPDRDLPDQGCDRLQPEEGRRPRRGAGEARATSRTARCCSASSPPG